jgi:hypothetical protein
MRLHQPLAVVGAALALPAQGKDELAGLIEARFERIWARADVTLTASR